MVHSASPPRFRILPATIACLSLLLVAKLYDIYETGNRFSRSLLPSTALAQEEAEPAEEARKTAQAKAKPETEEEDAPKADAAGDESDILPDQPERQFSKVEVDILQSLSKRREELDELEEKIRLKGNLLEATETRLDKKIKQIKELESVVRELLAKYDNEEDKRIQSLVKIYEKAAEIFNQMQLETLMLVVERMSERRAAPVMAAMDPKKANELTQELAEDRKLRTEQEQELNNIAGQ
jgi:flagellar motility protein MotE (MotC chaperone)